MNNKPSPVKELPKSYQILFCSKITHIYPSKIQTLSMFLIITINKKVYILTLDTSKKSKYQMVHINYYYNGQQFLGMPLCGSLYQSFNKNGLNLHNQLLYIGTSKGQIIKIKILPNLSPIKKQHTQYLTRRPQIVSICVTSDGKLLSVWTLFNQIILINCEKLQTRLRFRFSHDITSVMNILNYTQQSIMTFVSFNNLCPPFCFPESILIGAAEQQNSDILLEYFNQCFHLYRNHVQKEQEIISIAETLFKREQIQNNRIFCGIYNRKQKKYYVSVYRLEKKKYIYLCSLDFRFRVQMNRQKNLSLIRISVFDNRIVSIIMNQHLLLFDVENRSIIQKLAIKKNEYGWIYCHLENGQLNLFIIQGFHELNRSISQNQRKLNQNDPIMHQLLVKQIKDVLKKKGTWKITSLNLNGNK